MKYIIKFIEKFFHFVPALVFYIMYATIPAIPFVEVKIWAWVFVGALALAGLLLFMNSYIGVVVGILSCIIAIIADYISVGSMESTTITLCIIVCIYFLICAGTIQSKRGKDEK